MTTSKPVVIDVEANGLRDYTEIWCIVTYCLETKELKKFVWNENRTHIEEFKQYARDITHWVGHNAIDYDRHVLHALTGVGLIPVARINDTLVRSRLFNSGRIGQPPSCSWRMPRT